jgi:bacterioferritin
MKPRTPVIQKLNGIISIELAAINQYFTHCKICENWGYAHLAHEFREASFAEMKDTEALMDRVLDLGGLPNLQRLNAFQVGETVREQLRLAAALEGEAVAAIKEGVTVCDKEGDVGTSALLRPMVLSEEGQLAWLEAQLALLEQLGEAQYLALQVRE